MINDNSVNKLIENNLCYQCGTCKSICPTSAIQMQRVKSKGYIYPKINKDKCINCSKCLKVCPINNIDCSENHLPTNSDYIGIYNTTDKERFDATASGGVVTEIISYLFKEKKINKAIVTGMDKESATYGKVYIIENIKNLKELSGSVYQPVSVNEVLDKIEVEDKVAFVGLPCHIKGLNLFLKQRQKLNEAFVIKIGLICTIGRGKHGTDLTLKKSFKINDFLKVDRIFYRYGMPPGKFKIRMKSQVENEIQGIDFLQNTDYIFLPKGCLFCTDLFNDEADITVGDPWGMNKGKKAMAIVRNVEVKTMLDEMISKNLLVFDEAITAKECVKTQSHSVNYKIYNYLARISSYKKLWVAMPNIKNIKNEKSTFKEYFGYNLLLINSLIFNTKVGFSIARFTPNKILYKYRNIILNINTKRRME